MWIDAFHLKHGVTDTMIVRISLMKWIVLLLLVSLLFRQIFYSVQSEMGISQKFPFSHSFMVKTAKTAPRTPLTVHDSDDIGYEFKQNILQTAVTVKIDIVLQWYNTLKEWWIFSKCTFILIYYLFWYMLIRCIAIVGSTTGWQFIVCITKRLKTIWTSIKPFQIRPFTIDKTTQELLRTQFIWMWQWKNWKWDTRCAEWRIYTFRMGECFALFRRLQIPNALHSEEF